MLIIYILFIIVLFYAFYDLKKAILAYSSLRLIFHQGICLRYESPNITFDFAMCLAFWAISLMKKPKIQTIIPNKNGYCALFVSYFIAIITSHYSLTKSVPYMMGTIVTLLFSILFYQNLISWKDYRKYFNVLFIVMIAFTLYGTYEYLTQSNPLVEYERSILPEEFYAGRIYVSGQLRLNSIRCQSLASISISFGVICALWFMYVSAVYSSIKNRSKRMLVYITVVLGLISGCYYSGAKTPFIYIMTYFGLFIMFGKIKLVYKLIFAFIIIFGLYSFALQIMDFYMSIVDSSKSSFEGSDIIMRLGQFQAVLKVVGENLLWGLGARGVAYAQEINPLILGAESIWFQLYIEQGFIGIFCYVFFWISLYKMAKILEDVGNRRKLFFMIVAWLATNTVSSLPGLDTSIFVCLYYSLLFYYKSKENNSLSKQLLL